MPVPPVRDHNALINLAAGDPHTQYLTQARGDARYPLSSAVLLKASNLSDLANVATARTNLGLGSAALSATSDFATASHTHAHNSLTGLTTGDPHTQYLTQSRGDARYALLGSGVTDYGGRTGSVTFEGGDFIAVFGGDPLIAGSNLSDITDASAARSNLGLGSAALAADTDFAPSSLISAGTAADSMIRWDGGAWVQQSLALLDQYGRAYFNPGAIPNAGPSVTDSTVTIGARLSNLPALVLYGRSGQIAPFLDCRAYGSQSVFSVAADGAIKVGSTVSGTVVFMDTYGRLWVNSGGLAGFDGSLFDAAMGVYSRSASLPVIVIRGQSGQTEPLIDWQVLSASKAQMLPSGDLKIMTASAGPILKDRSNGNFYRLLVSGGALSVEAA